VDKSYRHHLKNAAEKVIATIASIFTELLNSRAFFSFSPCNHFINK
jgi:hypothetical protein